MHGKSCADQCSNSKQRRIVITRCKGSICVCSLYSQVHLVKEDLQDKLIQTLRAEYYNKRFPDLTEEQLAESIFATKPEEGACLYVLD